METKFSWLHFSDIHVGMNSQGWKWPTVENLLHNDIEFLINKNGRLDLVVFSGDMAQSGKAEEYKKLTEILKRIWAIFNANGLDPAFFCVPGNHDLQRPNEMDPHYMAFSSWWEKDQLREKFWEIDGAEFLKAQKGYFSNYMQWLDSLGSHGIKVLRGKEGLLPGDSSAIIDNGKVKVGVVGLNSTWLQLAGGNLKGKLHVDPRQLLSVTYEKPDEWVKDNHLNILVTHHPLDWLHEKSIEVFDQEIDVAGRFQAHLFGHMHEPVASERSYLGLKPKRSLQSASLFGLEYFGQQEKRIHGYSWCSILANAGESKLIMWPRATRAVSGGQLMLGANMEMPINNDNYIEHSFELNNRGGRPSLYSDSVKLSEELPSSISIEAESQGALLSAIEENLKGCPQALKVREVALREASKIIADSRVLWLVADWGLGDRGFLWALREVKGHQDYGFFSINVSDYKNNKYFIEGFKQKHGASFPVICQQLAKEKAYLVFDEIPFPLESDGAHQIQREFDELAEMIKSFCPEIFIVLRSRQRPPASDGLTIELAALDQVDTKSYIENHTARGAAYINSLDINRIYNHTAGWPNLIDSFLLNLAVASVSEVLRSSRVSGLSTNSLLARAVLDLADSEDEVLQRAYLLLKVLAVFPCGEDLSNIKNFVRGKPMFPDHARILLQRGFIRTTDSIVFEKITGGEIQRKLVVVQPVREWLHSQMAPSELKKQYESAARFYFGSDWANGLYKPGAIYRFDKPGRQATEIENAKLILLRLVAHVLNDKFLKNIHSLVSSHGAALMKGGYYKSASDIFYELSPYFDGKLGLADVHFTYYLYARSLRMIGGEENVEKAKSLLVESIPYLSGNSVLLSAKINLAMVFKKLEENEKAVELANEVIKISRKSNEATMARQLIIELSAREGIEGRLLELEARAKKEKHAVAAFNIAMSRSDFIKSSNEKAVLLSALLKQSKESGEFYNMMRAAVALGRMYLGDTVQLDHATKRLMVSIYHYLYNESFDNSFGVIHKVLWKTFSDAGDARNLLQLFQYSSFHWRLSGDVDAEKSGIESMKQYFAKRQRAFEESPQAAAYYAARLSAK